MNSCIEAVSRTQHWMNGTAELWRRDELQVPEGVQEFFVANLKIDDKGRVSGTLFGSPKSAFVVAVGPRRWSIMLDLNSLSQTFEDIPDLAPELVHDFVEKAVRLGSYVLRLENHDASVTSESGQ